MLTFEEIFEAQPLHIQREMLSFEKSLKRGGFSSLKEYHEMMQTMRLCVIEKTWLDWKKNSLRKKDLMKIKEAHDNLIFGDTNGKS